jgi:maltooligosyltrehalose trehalohydrolase
MAGELTVALADGGTWPLAREPGGYFSGRVAGVGHESRYRFRLDGGEPLPDPASRWQPEGPLGPSAVVDPGRYRWRDQVWRGVPRHDQVLYELHVGTFTPQGTYRAAAAKLPHLAEVGVSCVEVMPVNNFRGRFGWGYDGVNLFAPFPPYGEPDDLRFFVDEAHGHGIGVILDVVFNHLGVDGGFLKKFAPAYFSDRYVTDWGEALNFDGEDAGPVREWVVANGRYWVEEFHVDGFRVDATQSIYDFGEGHEHILAEFAAAAREAAGGRAVLVVGENEPQVARLIRPRRAGGLGLDMLWNDDYHHSAIVALTGRNEAYLTDHRGAPQEFVSAAKHGFLYQGQRYRWQKMARGTPTKALGPEQFVCFTQNHDQIANMGRGLRAHQLAGPGRLRSVTALTLLGPGTPLLFQGEEFAASQPFWFFLDGGGESAEAVAAGRRKEVAQFRSLAEREVQAVLPRPEDPRTFERCKLDWGELDGERNRQLLALYRDLLRLRREDPALRFARRERGRIDGAVVGPEAFCLRFFGPNDDDRLLLVNLGFDLELLAMPEPLLAPPEGHDWELLWSSEHPDYGGTGAQHPRPDTTWVLPGHGALLLRPGPPSPRRRSEREKALDKAKEQRSRAGRQA